MEWQIAAQTHCGHLRRLNEDALHVDRYYPMFAVADGMGGHRAGDVASRMLIEELAATELEGELPQALAKLEDAILRSNGKVIDYANRTLEGQTIGSTIVAMLAHKTTGAGVWAGDSRLYQVRNNRLTQLTQDHSYVADLVRRGELSAEDAVDHPSSNIISRAVGAAKTLELETKTFDVALGDTFLLCSDGLYNEVSEDSLLKAMLAVDIHQSAQQLLNLCLAGEARDNITFIMARTVESRPDDLDATVTYYPTADADGKPQG